MTDKSIEAYLVDGDDPQLLRFASYDRAPYMRTARAWSCGCCGYNVSNLPHPHFSANRSDL